MKKNQKFKLFILILAGLLFVTGCATNESKQGKLDVKVQVWAMKYLVEGIGKEHVNVSLAVESGDAHHKEPTQKEIAELSKSSLFFYIDAGDLGREAQELMKATGGSQVKNSNLFQGVEPLLKGSDNDPHIWLSPKQMKVMAKTVKEKLIEKKVDQKAEFEKNYQRVNEELDTLDQTFKALFANKTKEEVLVEHAAYGYLARDYGFSQHLLTDDHHGENHESEHIASNGSEHAELSASQVETLKKIVVEEQFMTLFADSQNQSETIEKVAKELNITLIKIPTLETLSQEEANKGYVKQMETIAEQFAKELTDKKQ